MLGMRVADMSQWDLDHRVARGWGYLRRFFGKSMEDDGFGDVEHPLCITMLETILSTEGAERQDQLRWALVDPQCGNMDEWQVGVEPVKEGS